MNEALGIHRYQENDLSSRGPEKMIVLLYEAVERYIQKAQAAIAEGNLADKVRCINAAQVAKMVKTYALLM